MNRSFPIAKTARQLRAFGAARGGNVLTTFALALVPIVALTGSAVDYSRANLVKSSMQAALDATALMLARTNAVATMSSSQQQSTATSYFFGLFNRPEAQNVVLSPPQYDQPTSTLTLTASASVKADFLGIMMMPKLDVSGTATVTWGSTRLRVALALDNTGSMSSAGKMTALKSAAHNLLTQLKNAATQNGDVYVSIIPFSKDVNVDPINYSQSWIRWSGLSDTWNENNGTCSKSWYSNKSSCTSNGGKWTRDNHNTWNGCVMDRDQDYDVSNTAPSSTDKPTLFPAEQYGNCPVPLMGLSYNWTALNNKIDAMSPNGTTNQAIGLQWAWQSLTAAPFTIPPLDPNYKYQQVIILLTDGLNTQDRWYGNGSSVSSQVDARQQTLCNNIKAAGITLYTVQVNTDGDATSTLLQNCASSADKFFLLTSASQIVTTFQQIGTSLSQLRIAK